MSRFNETLAEADSRLGVAEPARSRILLELAADMEGLFREYLERGVPEGEAEVKVKEHFQLSDETLRDLVRIHDTPLQRSLGGLARQLEGPWSRLLVVLLALSVVVASGTLLVQSQLYRDASALVWLLMPLLAMGVIWGGIRVVALLRARNEWRRDLSRGPARLLALAVAIPGLSLVGLWIQLYSAAVRIRGAPEEAMIHLVGWMHMASATLVVAFSGSLILAFIWFFLESRARRMEKRALASLLGGLP